MPDLSIPQATFDRVHGGELVFYRLWRCLKELYDRCTRERIQVLNENDTKSATAHLTLIDLDGSVVEFNVNTRNDGVLIVRFVANASNWDVELYKATGGAGGDLVSKATNVAAGATGTLVAQSASGIEGTIKLGATIAGDVADKHRLRIITDFRLQARTAFPADGVIEQDTFALQVAYSVLDGVANDLRAAMKKVTDGLGDMLLGDADHEGVGEDVFDAVESVLYAENVSVDGANGNVSTVRDGMIERQRQVQRDDTDAGAQTVKERDITVGAAVFTGTGLGAISPTVGERCPAGRLILACEEGVNNDALGRERFSVRLAVDEAGDKRSITLDDVLVGATYSGKLGITFQLSRSFTKTNDGSNVKLAASGFAFINETNDNTDAGQVYLKITGSGPFTYAFYRSSARTAGYLVAQAEGVTANTAFEATAQDTNGVAGLTITGTAGSAPANNATCELMCNPFYSDNAGEKDQIEIPITVASPPGLIQTTTERMTGGEFNSTSGTPTLKDELLVAGTFPPFLTALDN